MIKPLISVIIPIYNAEKYLRRCLDSVLNQTFAEWEAICVNDGSPDNSDKILAEYAARDKRFKIINKKNAGVSSARNDGVKMASGKYIMFVDSDDCIHPQTFSIAYRFAANGHVDMVSFRINRKLYTDVLNGKNVDDGIKTATLKYYEFEKIKYKKTKNLINYATERNHKLGRFVVRHCYPVVHLFKRDLIQNIKFNSNIKIFEDFPFFTSVLLQKPHAVILRLPLYFYIPNRESALGAVDNKKLFDNASMAIMDAFNNVGKFADSLSWTQRWNREFLWPFIIMCVRSAQKLNKKYIRLRLKEMNNLGVFDNPTTMRARKYKRRIENFIHQI